MRTTFILFSCFPFLIFEDVVVKKETVDLYLFKFGYLQPVLVTRKGHGKVDGEGNKAEAIKAFQVSKGLKPTGVLDDWTWREMKKHRRANALGNFKLATSLNLTDQFDNRTGTEMRLRRCGRAKPVTLGGPTMRWKKRNLTYSIENFLTNTEEFDATRIKEVIQKAFSMFSDATNTFLSFTEVRSNKSDIKIKFESKVHSNCETFDGLGGIVAHAYAPEDGRIHFDDEEGWLDFENMQDEFVDIQSRKIHSDLLTIAIHEIGHALGLEHVNNNSKSIMTQFPAYPIDEDFNYVAPTLDQETIGQLYSLYNDKIPDEDHIDQQCMSFVYAALHLPGHRIVFFPREGTKWAMFNSESLQIVQYTNISELFIGGPSKVEAAYYNKKYERIVLFQKNMVWAYDFNERLSEVALANNYPMEYVFNGDVKNLISDMNRTVNMFSLIIQLDRGLLARLWSFFCLVNT